VAVIDRTIDVHIVSLRRKLGSHGELIETVRGVGYRLRE
jgi:two-component system phosphate regulon response regulator PhoB